MTRGPHHQPSRLDQFVILAKSQFGTKIGHFLSCRDPYLNLWQGESKIQNGPFGPTVRVGGTSVTPASMNSASPVEERERGRDSRERREKERAWVCGRKGGWVGGGGTAPPSSPHADPGTNQIAMKERIPLLSRLDKG